MLTLLKEAAAHPIDRGTKPHWAEGRRQLAALFKNSRPPAQPQTSRGAKKTHPTMTQAKSYQHGDTGQLAAQPSQATHEQRAAFS
jgi:hypothetical protein